MSTAKTLAESLREWRSEGTPLEMVDEAADELERQSKNAAILAQQVANLTAELQREHEDHKETIADAALYLSEAERLRAERDALRAVANEALDEVESWAAYASDYFRNKHDLVGILDRLRAAIDAARGNP